MYMPLIAAEDGIAQFVKQPGTSLNPGDILGILTLDNPARVKHAKPFDGLLPPTGMPNVIGNKANQRYDFNVDILNMIDGYDNQAVMTSTLKDLEEVLDNSTLPYTEILAVLAILSGRMPAKLEESLRATIEASKAKMLEFPAPRIRKSLDTWLADSTRPQERTATRTQLGPLFDIAERYRAGLKSAKWNTIATLLTRYLTTEKLFSDGGSIEERVLKLREENKEDLGRVAQLVLSHTRTQGKNKLMLALLEIVKAGGSTVAALEPGMNDVIKGLASLETR